MAISRRLSALGLQAFLAQNVVGDVGTGLTGAGTNQATALQLQNVISEFSTVGSGSGCQVPADMLGLGDSVTVYNAAASNALLVYGLTGDSIQTGAANAGFSVAAGKSAVFFRTSATTLRANLSA